MIDTLLASYRTPSGATLCLHYKGHFWTERRDGPGSSLVLIDDLQRAHDHYEYAREHGKTYNSFPVKFRGAVV